MTTTTAILHQNQDLGESEHMRVIVIIMDLA